MQILQKHTTNFSIIDNNVLQDSGLSLDARGLYAYMISLPNDWHFSYDRLASANNVGLRVIRRCINELQNTSLLEIERTRTNKGIYTVYKLYDSHTKPCKTIGKNVDSIQNIQNDRQKECIKQATNNANNDISKQSTQDNQTNILQGSVLQGSKMKPLKKKDNIQRKNLDSKESKKENIKRKNEILDFAKEIFQKESPKYFSLQKWLEWVEYKKERLSYKLTKNTISFNLKKLIEFEDLAEQAIDNSILNGWQGLFLPKRQYTHTYTSAEELNAQLEKESEGTLF